MVTSEHMAGLSDAVRFTFILETPCIYHSVTDLQRLRCYPLVLPQLRMRKARGPPATSKAIESNLIVLRDPRIPDLAMPTDPAKLIELSRSESDAAKPALALLSSPSQIHYLITERPTVDYIANLKFNSPEWRLLNSVVLRYADADAASKARASIVETRLFLTADQDSAVYSSTTPDDSYFAPSGQSSPLNKQWGMSALALPDAWTTQTGYAYLGVIDNGIQRNHPDLTENRAGNVRVHFSGTWSTGVPEPALVDFDEGSTAAYKGHGTHVAGIIAANTNNSNGVSGTCWRCALSIARISPFSQSTVAMSIYGTVRRGVQSINLSLGFAGIFCGGTGTQEAVSVFCDAVQFAADRDVIIVAAAGNNKTDLQFPASDTRTFSVGGYQSDGQPWDQTVALNYDSPARVNDGQGETGTNFGSNQLVVAPARDVLSTFYVNSVWNNRCGSVSVFSTAPEFLQFVGPVTQSIHASASGNLYGICTGTSMAAPHITGLVGLIRSTNPLLTTAQTRSILQQSAGGVFVNTTIGYGLPNASVAVLNSLPSQRLTPLFAFYNSSNDDYAYTVFPQMGAALNSGSVRPYASGSSTGAYLTDSWIGNYVAQYPTTFAGVTISVKPGQVYADNYRPRARLQVFSTPTDGVGNVLWPICRFSYVASSKVRHLMDTSASCATSPMPALAVLDGQEGFIYPPNQGQPSGTVAVIRMEKIPSGGGPTVFVLTAQSDQSYYSGQGFSNSVVLGYAYLN